MQIEIPGDAEPLLKRNAALAGFDDVREYVISLILEDDPKLEALPEPNDPRILRAIDDGYASGVAGTAEEVFPELHKRLEERIAARKQGEL